MEQRNDDHQYVGATDSLNLFYSKIYGFLGLGLAVSAVTSYFVLSRFLVQTLTFVANFPLGFIGIWLVEIALVVFLSSRAQQAQKNPALAIIGFVVYSVLNGGVLAITMLYYTQQQVFSAFVSASATFIAMSAVGLLIKKDISGIGRACLNALVGIIIAILLNAFILKSSPVSFFIGILMVIVFSGLTAYDNQRIKGYYYSSGGHKGTGIAIFFALQLYLDFINLFLAFLRIFGRNN